MKNFYVLTDALEYIENNICEEVDSQAVADYCGVSLSSLQKLFRLALHRSVKDYVLRRRISLAAKDILDGKLLLRSTKKHGGFLRYVPDWIINIRKEQMKIWQQKE